MPISLNVLNFTNFFLYTNKNYNTSLCKNHKKKKD